MKFEPYSGPWLHQVEGDDKYFYRAVPDRHAHLVEPLHKSPFFVPFERTDFRLTVGSNQCQVIKIKRLPFQVRIQELTRAQALKMVKFLVDFAIHSHAQGLTPSDTHESNVLWWDGPVFVDLDALERLSHRTAALTFVRIGYLLYRYVFGRPLTDHATFNFDALRALGGWMGEQTKHPDFTDPLLWGGLKNILTTITPPVGTVSHWSDEYALSTAAGLAATPKFAAVVEMVPPGRTLLDVGCNKGYLAQMLQGRFESILGFDSDEASVGKSSPQPGLNFARFGFEQFRNTEPTPIHERFCADVVVALAVTHHFNNAGFSVAFVADTLMKLSRRYLLIEDIVHVASYADKLRAQGFTVAAHKTSFPESRTLTLWERPA